MVLYGKVIYTYIFLGSITTSYINNISSSDLVYTKTDKRQIQIEGCQTFLANVNLESNSSVNILNGKSLTKSYQENVKVNENATINGSLVSIKIVTNYCLNIIIFVRNS